MVWHHDPRKEVVSNAIKLQQRILNYLRDSPVFQKTLSISLIKISFDPSLQRDLFLVSPGAGLILFASVR